MALFKVLPLFSSIIRDSITNSIIPKYFHCLSSPVGQSINPGHLFDVSFRTHVRDHFPRPNERKRIKRHGWNKKMSSADGRRVLMNRILKGRHVYAH